MSVPSRIKSRLNDFMGQAFPTPAFEQSLLVMEVASSYSLLFYFFFYLVLDRNTYALML